MTMRNTLVDRLGAFLAAAPGAPVARELIRNSPIPESTKYTKSLLDDAFDKQVDELKPGAQVFFDTTRAVPKGDTVIDRLVSVSKNPTAYAGSTKPGVQPAVGINPNADRALYAHELGHLASQQSDIGHLVANLRHNPQLSKALITAGVLGSGTYAALNAGDDDYDEAALVAALSAAPTLVDEGLATRQGLAIMDKAGMRADIGQRGKLAGGLLSYLTVPLLAGAAATAVGNIFDKDKQQQMIAN